jgi:hypothetical protein
MANLYVFRHNYVLRNLPCHAVDAHEGGTYGNQRATRYFEVHHNVVRNAVDRWNIPLTDFPVAAPPRYPGRDPDGCFDDPKIPHVFPQDYARDRLANRGMFFRGGDGVVFANIIDGFQLGLRCVGEVFVWGNTFNPGHWAGYQGDTDGSAKLTERPGYKPYAYPHPNRSAGYVSYAGLAEDRDKDDDGDGLTNLGEFLNDTGAGASTAGNGSTVSVGAV